MSILVKKIAACFLLAIVLAPSGYVFVFHAKQEFIRQHMKQQLEAKMLHTVVLAAKDVIWYKPGKEIVVDGKMFDIKSASYRDDGSVAFTGLFDKEETLLRKQLQQKQQHENSKGNKQLVQLLHLAQSLPCEDPADDRNWQLISADPYEIYTPSLPCAYTRIPTPPPQG